MSWQRFQQHTLFLEELGFSIDISRMNFGDGFLASMEPRMQAAFAAMAELEGGSTANPDEARMVGHYWLRAPQIAPSVDITSEIESTLVRIREFAARVHRGEIAGSGGPFTDLLVIGIGGSALGPQFVAQALGGRGNDRLRVHFFDNTDPDGIDRTLADLGDRLGTTMAVVISKSGSTPETRNGMIEAKHAWKQAGLDFGEHAVAITGSRSKLDRTAAANAWIERFPMWDWVGGRTSETGPVGLLPAALQGLDIDSLLEGAAAMDAATRAAETTRNPAALLALMWFHATGGRGQKDMVILPYKDRLELFSKYLQQLVMESLGKEKDLDGNTVHQGIAVYGNKGSTDQHAYVQQLREGVNNFFVTFIEVLRDREGESIEVDEGVTSGDYLQGFLLGTRAALHEKERESITITIDEVTPRVVGQLIALYERAVGLYAFLVNINAYHQPGVEAGKKAAAEILQIRRSAVDLLSQQPGEALTADAIAAAIGQPESAETIFKLLHRLSRNPASNVEQETGDGPAAVTFRHLPPAVH